MPRKKSAAKKTKKQYSLNSELVKKVQLKAAIEDCFDSIIVEQALKLYFEANPVSVRA